MAPHDTAFVQSKAKLIETVDMQIENNSFLVQETIIMHLPEVLMLLSRLVLFKNKVRHTKFNSLVCNTMPSVVTAIACHSRRVSGSILCSRGAMHMTDPRCFLKD